MENNYIVGINHGSYYEIFISERNIAPHYFGYVKYKSIRGTCIGNALNDLILDRAGTTDPHTGNWMAVPFVGKITDENGKFIKKLCNIQRGDYPSFTAYVRKKEKLKGRVIPTTETLRKYIDEYSTLLNLDKVI